jgi:hypothetical protein
MRHLLFLNNQVYATQSRSFGPFSDYKKTISLGFSFPIRYNAPIPHAPHFSL